MRKEKTRGGVAIYTRKGLKTIVRNDLIENEEGLFESSFIEIISNCNQKNIILGELYRIPGTNEKIFLDKFKTIINKVKSEDKELVLGCDQNIDFLKINCHANTADLLEISLKGLVIPTIMRPTRVTHQTATLIDNIYISHKLTKNYKSGIIITDISDHFACFVMISHSKIIKENLTYKNRNLNIENISLIKNALSQINWDFMNDLNTNESYTHFTNTLQSTLDRFAPETIRMINKTDIIKEPWITKGILKSSRRIHKLFLVCVCKYKGDPQYDKYLKERNKLNSLKRKAKINYYQTLIINYRNDSKKLWKTINEITGKGKNKKDSIDYMSVNGINKYNKLDIADSFCEHYCQPERPGCKTDNLKKFTDYISKNVKESIYFYPTDKYEIHTIITNLKNSNSFGHDKISNKLIKQISAEISTPLETIFNKSLQEGAFPKTFKHAHIIPIHKQGNKHELSNYRPIALLCCLSKILEKIIFKRVYKFLENHNLFQDLQFGFRKNMGTADAITFFLNKLIPSLDRKEFNLSLFIDLSKAFDKININILLYKLNKLGIRGIPLKWFTDYLSSRTQSVRISNENNNEHILSKSLSIDQGVPQGSILGPLLFLIYISDMPNAIKHGTTISYADDTTILISNNNFEDLYIQAYENMNSLMEYLNVNKLKINLQKTKYILFRPNSKRNVLDIPPKLIIDNTEIIEVNSTKFLGVFIDSKVNWYEQVKNVVNKLKQNVYIFSVARTLLPTHAKKLLYNAHICSHLSYAAVTWAPMINQTQINRIQKIINNIILKITNTTKIRNYNKVYQDLGILKVCDSVDFELCKFMFKIINKLSPECINNCFPVGQNTYNTRNKNLPHIMQHKTNLYNKSFLAKAILKFSHLPEEIKNAKSLNSFKKRLKKYIIKKY